MLPLPDRRKMNANLKLAKNEASHAQDTAGDILEELQEDTPDPDMILPLCDDLQSTVSRLRSRAQQGMAEDQDGC